MAAEFQNEFVATMTAWQTRVTEWRAEKALLEDELATAQSRSDELRDLLRATEGKLAASLEDVAKWQSAAEDTARSATAEIDRANGESSALRLTIEMNERAAVRERERHVSALTLAKGQLAEEQRATRLLRESILNLERFVVDRNRRTIATLQQEHNALQKRLDGVYASKFWLAKNVASGLIGRATAPLRWFRSALRKDARRSAAS